MVYKNPIMEAKVAIHRAGRRNSREPWTGIFTIFFKEFQ